MDKKLYFNSENYNYKCFSFNVGFFTKYFTNLIYLLRIFIIIASCTIYRCNVTPLHWSTLQNFYWRFEDILTDDFKLSLGIFFFLVLFFLQFAVCFTGFQALQNLIYVSHLDNVIFVTMQNMVLNQGTSANVSKAPK